MNLERTKPETLAAGVMDLTPSQSLAAHEYAERLNAALARLGLTDRLMLPSAPATAIDELPGVVDVPLRKTLSVLMGKAQQGDASALATLEWTAQVAESIFAGLHARASVYPLALPSHESLATLSQGVDALLPRKISTGWSVASLLADPTCDGIDDGVSLVRLLCSSAANSVTELKDDNEGWVMTTSKLGSMLTMIPATYVHMNCSGELSRGCINGNHSIKVIDMPHIESIIRYESSLAAITTCNNLEEVILKGCTTAYARSSPDYPCIHLCPNLKKLVLGTLISYRQAFWQASSANLIHFEIGAGTAITLDFSHWIPTNVLSDSERLPIFLSNFKTYIAERLSEQGSGLTLTLSQAVRDAIEGDPTIAQIITSKGWTISPAPSV